MFNVLAAHCFTALKKSFVCICVVTAICTDGWCVNVWLCHWGFSSIHGDSVLVFLRIMSEVTESKSESEQQQSYTCINKCDSLWFSPLSRWQMASVGKTVTSLSERTPQKCLMWSVFFFIYINSHSSLCDTLWFIFFHKPQQVLLLSLPYRRSLIKYLRETADSI